jgi:hypothetical protein
VGISVEQSGQPSFRLRKADSIFAERADLKGVRAVYETLPPSVKDDPKVTADRVYYAMCARDFAAAEEIVSKTRWAISLAYSKVNTG